VMQILSTAAPVSNQKTNFIFRKPKLGRNPRESPGNVAEFFSFALGATRDRVFKTCRALIS